MASKAKKRGFDGAPPVLIASFTYKGGAGKTTLSLNLAADLASRGHRVGLVDCDSQCNLSTFFNPEPEHRVLDEVIKDDDDEDGAASDEDFVLDSQEEAGIRGPIPALIGFKIQPEPYRYAVDLIKQGCFDRSGNRFPVTIKTIWEEARDDKSIVTDIVDLRNDSRFDGASLPQGLYLVPGDPDLSSSLESPFHNARQQMHQRGSDEPFRVLSAFRRGLLAVGEAHGLQYLLCDFGPSAGILNQVLIMSCDYIMPCFQPDFFSASAVYGFLHNAMPAWMDFFRSARRCSKRNLADHRFAFNASPPRILPFLMNNFALEGKRDLTLMDSAFFNLVLRTVEGEEYPVPPEVKLLYLPDCDNKMVAPFLRSVPVALKVAQELAQPASLITPQVLKQFYKARLPRGVTAESRLVARAFKSLGAFVTSACIPRQKGTKSDATAPGEGGTQANALVGGQAAEDTVAVPVQDETVQAAGTGAQAVGMMGMQAQVPLLQAAGTGAGLGMQAQSARQTPGPVAEAPQEMQGPVLVAGAPSVSDVATEDVGGLLALGNVSRDQAAQCPLTPPRAAGALCPGPRVKRHVKNLPPRAPWAKKARCHGPPVGQTAVDHAPAAPACVAKNGQGWVAQPAGSYDAKHIANGVLMPRNAGTGLMGSPATIQPPYGVRPGKRCHS